MLSIPDPWHLPTGSLEYIRSEQNKRARDAWFQKKLKLKSQLPLLNHMSFCLNRGGKELTIPCCLRTVKPFEKKACYLVDYKQKIPKQNNEKPTIHAFNLVVGNWCFSLQVFSSGIGCNA